VATRGKRNTGRIARELNRSEAIVRRLILCVAILVVALTAP